MTLLNPNHTSTRDPRFMGRELRCGRGWEACPSSHSFQGRRQLGQDIVRGPPGVWRAEGGGQQLVLQQWTTGGRSSGVL